MKIKACIEQSVDVFICFTNLDYLKENPKVQCILIDFKSFFDVLIINI